MFNKIQVLFRKAFTLAEQQEILAIVHQNCPTWDLDLQPREGVSLILCIGGDGTLLRGVQERINKHIPVVGVNVGGHLGYLTADTDLVRALHNLNTGNYQISEKALVNAVVHDNGQAVANLEALNEVVLRGENNKPIVVKVTVAGSTVESVFGDGLMISTPTGSTAYNLSVGGPLVDTLCQVLIITPIAPLDLNIRPIVIPDTQEITLSLSVRTNERKYLFADSQELELGQGNYEIVVSKSAQPLKVLEFPAIKSSFFQILHDRTLGQRQGGL